MYEDGMIEGQSSAVAVGLKLEHQTEDIEDWVQEVDDQKFQQEALH